MTDQADALLVKINAAVKAANEAETSVKTAQAELVSRSQALGLLLLEAKKQHPKKKDLRLAGGRTTDEELREEARERKRKSRDKAKDQPKLKPKQPTPEPKKESVTVTDSAEESAERRKAEYAQAPEEKAASAANLREFEYACSAYLPQLNEADLEKARAFVRRLGRAGPYRSHARHQAAKGIEQRTSPMDRCRDRRL
jgi:hypothetical protein